MSKSKKRLNIGFFTCHLDNDYAYEVCKGVDYAAKELDVNLVVFPGMYMNASYNDPKNARFDYQYNSIFYYASKHTLDAIIVSIGSIGTFLSENDMLAFLKNFDIPILTIEIEVPGYPYLYTEGRTGMREAVEHLIKVHGKTKIGMVGGRKENADAKERLDTYCQVLEENGIPVDHNRIVYGNFSEFTEGIVNDLLDRNPDLEAIVFANDQMAIGGYNAIKARGLEIGKDILVTGYDDAPVSTVLNPLLTTVHNSIVDMGYQSVYEVINLIQNGKTNKSILNSSLIVRSSCGCKDMALDSRKDACKISGNDSDYKKTKKFIIEHLLYDYRNAFYYKGLIKAIGPFFDLLLAPIFKKNDFVFDMDAIKSELQQLLREQIINSYFSVDKFIYIVTKLKNLLLSMFSDDSTSNKISLAFSGILETMLFHTTSKFYNTVRKQKANIWSSMYITRDTLTYSTDEEACFKLIMEKLQDAHFISSYIYVYEEPVMLLPNGSWKIPSTLYLQACHDLDKITYLSGDSRMISSDNVFNNAYTNQKRRRTMVVTPLFTNSVQYGLFIGEIDIEHFGSIYPQSLQLSTSLNFISLMKQQLSIQKKLAISATELNNKNELLNKLSITDALTGINNRRGFLDSVQSQISSQYNVGKQAMIVFADMDNLKQVNDTFGHKDGDFAIKSIANILQKSFGDDDIIGRIGGDEFVAFTMVDSLTYPSEIKAKIAEYSKELNDTDDKPYFIDVSIGIASFTCSPTMNIEEILHNADEALYENKKNKRKSVLKPVV